MPPRPSQRLELTWFNKDKALIPTSRGKYGYTWVDPRDPRYCEVHTLVETATVEGTQTEKEDGVTYSERADLEPTTDNLLIRGDSGDALEALRHVPELAAQYVGRVKLCYLDSPFNTQKTFTNYEDNLEHSIWLTMMRDRMIHIREMLSIDGSAWIHLDDSENHRMRCLLDELFGADNYVAEVAWEKTYSPENRSVFTQSHDIILIYAKSRPHFKGMRNLLPRSAGQDAAYINPDSDPRGPWKPGDFTAQMNPEENSRESQLYTLTTPCGQSYDPPHGSCWRYTEPRYKELVQDNRIYFGASGNGRPALKRFLSEVMQGRVPDSVWHHSDLGHNDTAKKEIRTLFPGIAPFDTPKPERFLERIIQIATNPGDLVLDVFAGSGTTAAVAHKMGRRWVTAELKSETVEKFTLPRLKKVVRGEDAGGVTTTTERLPANNVELPDGVTPDEAQKFNSTYTKVAEGIETPVDVAKATAKIVRQRAKDGDTTLTKQESKELLTLLRKLGKDDTAPEVDLLPDVTKQIRRATRTRDAEFVNWRGGGGFRVMELSPEVFDYDPELELVTLTDAAQGETLVASVAANLGFTRTPGEHPFHGRKGSMRLVVLDEQVTIELVDDVLAHLPEGQRVTIAAIGVPDGVRKHLRDRSRGSVIKHLPDDLFPFADTAAAAGSED